MKRLSIIILAMVICMITQVSEARAKTAPVVSANIELNGKVHSIKVRAHVANKMFDEVQIKMDDDSYNKFRLPVEIYGGAYVSSRESSSGMVFEYDTYTIEKDSDLGADNVFSITFEHYDPSWDKVYFILYGDDLSLYGYHDCGSHGTYFPRKNTVVGEITCLDDIRTPIGRFSGTVQRAVNTETLVFENKAGTWKMYKHDMYETSDYSPYYVKGESYIKNFDIYSSYKAKKIIGNTGNAKLVASKLKYTKKNGYMLYVKGEGIKGWIKLNEYKGQIIFDWD